MTYLRYLILLLATTFFFLIPPSPIFAQENIIMTISPSPTVAKTVDYTLPFPGMLPDNPLYFLKTGRDQIIGLLITDPYRKASFNLLQSEKRFQAGLMLYEQKPSKKDLAFATISKGDNYLEDAIHKLSDAQNGGADISDVRTRLFLSIKKQEQLLADLSTSHPVVASESQASIKRLQKLEQLAGSIAQSNQPKSK